MGFRVVASPDLIVDLQSAGSACCVWSDSVRRFVLSAAHVVESLPEHAPIQWLGDGYIGAGRTLSRSCSFLSHAGGVLDAAMIEIDDAGPFGHPESYPWAAPILETSALRPGASVVICGKFGPVFATFVETIPPGRQIEGRTYGPLLRFRYDSARTQKGDSGAAVISLPEGMLVGMHLGKEEDSLHSLGVSAEVVLAAFGGRIPGIDLVPGGSND